MNAQQCKQAVEECHKVTKAELPARIYSRIQDRATNGKNFLLCRSNKQTRKQLKDDGFRIILIYKLTLVRW